MKRLTKEQRYTIYVILASGAIPFVLKLRDEKRN